IIALATLPRIFTNYGNDEDAWRIARAADTLATTGRYEPSRLPGNPLFEYLLTPIIPFVGHIGSNLLVLLSYILAVAIFAYLALATSRGEGRGVRGEEEIET